MIITLHQVIIFLLIVARFAGMMIGAPFFNTKIQSLGSAKVALVLWSAGLLIFIVPTAPILPTTLFEFGIAIFTEVFIGWIITTAGEVIFSAMELAGALMDTQAGLSVASLLDPMSGTNQAIFGRLLRWIAIIVFLQMDGHHLIIAIIHKSFTVIPVGSSIHYDTASQFVVTLGTKVFDIGTKIAAPIILVIFIVDFAFGLLNRVSEQINVFQLGFQIKPLVALIVFLAITPVMTNTITMVLGEMAKSMLLVLGYLAGGV